VPGNEKEKERDWDREMREVDKLLAKLPDADPLPGREPGAPAGPGRGPMGGVPTVRTTPAVGGGRDVAGTWLKVGLGVLMGIGMFVWPYSHVCGLKLMFYMLGITTLVVAGVWSAVAAWRHRQGWAHLLSLLLISWGLMLMAATVLPRVGYAGQEAIWLCPEPGTVTSTRNR
jgi:hypothetical protein